MAKTTQFRNTEDDAEKQCALCGKLAELSFEHIPPQCAFNSKPILVQGFEHLVDEKSYVYGKKKRSQRGFGKRSLCVSCNNMTGNWYVKDFCRFTKQGSEALKTLRAPGLVNSEYLIKPHNVLKQILLMFIAADGLQATGNFPGVREYLLDRGNAHFPEKVDIYIYSNASSNKRMLGYCIAREPHAGQICRWAEINYRPFGYFFTYDSPPPNEFMVKINDFARVPYDKEVKMKLTTAYLEVGDMFIGTYSNLK